MACSKPAVFRVFWPGHAQEPLCMDHLLQCEKRMAAIEGHPRVKRAGIHHGDVCSGDLGAPSVAVNQPPEDASMEQQQTIDDGLL